MIDERALRERFAERAATAAVPGDAPLRLALAQIDERRDRRRSFRVPLSFATAAILVIVGGMLLIPPPPAPLGLSQIDHVKLEKIPTPPPLAVPAPKQIKINTLKTNAHAVSGDAQASSSQTVDRPVSALGNLQLARSASITLAVPSVEPAIAATTDIARANGGTVSALHDARAQTPDVVDGATMTILVPAERLDRAMQQLTALGAVAARTIDAESVGDAIVDTEARLRNLRSEERDLLAIMHRSGSVGDILDVEQKLADVRGQIESLEGERAHLRGRVATASIEVSLQAERKASPPPARPPVELIVIAVLVLGAALTLALWLFRRAP